MTNCIITDNYAGLDGQQFWYSSVPSHSCFPGAADRGNIDLNPSFASPGCWDPNGTPRDYLDDIWIAGDYHLTESSACIDAGSNLTGVVTDLSGVPRPLDGTSDGISTADMGCYEFNPFGRTLPVLEVNTRRFEFVGDVDGSAPTIQSLLLRNWGSGGLHWQLAENCPWLTVTPRQGQAGVDWTALELSANHTGLKPGDYSCTLEIQSDEAVNSPSRIEVALRVQGPEFGFCPRHLEWTILAGQSPAPVILSVRNHGSGTVHWQLYHDSPWLQISPSQGNLSAAQAERVDVDLDVSGFAPGRYQTSLLVSDDVDEGHEQVVPVIVNVVSQQLHVPQDHPTIQSAIDAAIDGCTVMVADGTYAGPGNRGLRFQGKAIMLQSENGPEHWIIDCEQQDRGFTFTSGEPPEAVLEGVSIINGRPHEAAGGGIHCKGARPTIRNCVIQHCQSTSGAGGGIYCAGNENQVISHCIISHNTADGINGGGGGGGIYIASTARWITVEHCTITHNRAVRREDATVDYYGKGGGIYYVGSYAGAYFRGPLRNCLIAHNQADLNGGGVAIDGYPPQMTNCTIAYNQATEGVGGFHATEDSRLPSTKDTVVNSIVWGNEPNNLSEHPNLCIGYSDIENGWSGDSNLGLDPLFVDPDGDDFHLQSQAGHWDPTRQVWVTDPVTSPCIDAGDPRTDWTVEPQPNGQRINVGAYGGTEEASRSPR
jgi:hypothetical protein